MKGSIASTDDVSSMLAAGSSPRYLQAAFIMLSCTEVPAPGLTSIFDLWRLSDAVGSEAACGAGLRLCEAAALQSSLLRSGCVDCLCC